MSRDGNCWLEAREVHTSALFGYAYAPNLHRHPEAVILRLVLASGSASRKMLLERLGIEFEVIVPRLSERPRRSETPAGLAGRLAEAKAMWGANNLDKLASSDNRSEHKSGTKADGPVLIIGSDQTAELDGELLRKPGNAHTARAQLKRASGREICFYTGVALFNTRTDSLRVAVEPYRVTFRDLAKDEIKRYVKAEEPFEQVGAFKSESLGITLFERVSGFDPTALVGLPLIRLTQFLQAEGVEIP